MAPAKIVSGFWARRREDMVANRGDDCLQDIVFTVVVCIERAASDARALDKRRSGDCCIARGAKELHEGIRDGAFGSVESAIHR